MKSSIFVVTFPWLLLFFSSLFEQGVVWADSMCRESGLQVREIPSIDTVGVVAIYAFSTTTGLSGRGMWDTLPAWWTDIWTDKFPNVPAYWRDVSYSKHGMRVAISVASQKPPLAWISNKSSRDTTAFPFPRPDFCHEIFSQVDSVFDFSEYDLTGPQGVPDHIVDAVILIIINDKMGNGSGIAFVPSYRTGDGVEIDIGSTQWVYSDYWVRRIICHEYGHLLGLPDLERWEVDHGLGSFSVMCAGVSRTGFFASNHPSPPDPWCQERLRWVNPIVVGEPRSEQIIRDRMTTGEVYKLISPADPKQYFLVSNENLSSPWQDNWPRPGGLMIWHVNQSGSSLCPHNPEVDLEVNPGKFLWDSTDSGWKMRDMESPDCGRDSLDVWGAYRVTDPNLIGVGSSNAYFGEGTQTSFEGPGVPGANPVSAFHRNSRENEICGKDTCESIESYIAITNIRRIDNDIVANLYVPLGHNPNNNNNGQLCPIYPYPNPFSRQTSIPYEVFFPGPVRLAVYNIAGELVRTLVSEVKDQGAYQVLWDGKNEDGRLVFSGVYLAYYQSRESQMIHKIVLLR